MSIVDWLMVVWVVPVCLLHCRTAARILRLHWKPKYLSEMKPPTPCSWPMISVIVPACNEQSTIRDALRTLLAQEYPNIEFIVVNDRSTDETGRVIDELAAADSRIKPVHIGELPKGWLGKVHALHQGVSIATGDWLLFTDADVHYGPDALKTALAYGLDRKLDFLAVAPKFVFSSVLQQAAIATFCVLLTLGAKLYKVGKKNSNAYMGVGAFNLVRRSAFAKTPGFAWLKTEVVDDAGLAYMLRQVGAKAEFLVGGTALSVRWYPSVLALVNGLEKNLVGVFSRYSIAKLIKNLGVLVLFVSAPLIAIAQQSAPWLSIIGGAALASTCVVFVSVSRAWRLSWFASLLSVLTTLVLLHALLRSSFLCFARGGIRWRGTFYPIEILKSGQRVRL